MNVLFISECSGNALKETRRILDQFAERRGERTWQTPITWDGLETVRKLLRKTARKNTAVACHWIRGMDHSELLWTVGTSSVFNSSGAVPTNTTKRKILRSNSENNWHHQSDIYLLAGLSSLLHDIGKACDAFQSMLNSAKVKRSAIRHEWISLRLFESFVDQNSDEDWLNKMANPDKSYMDSWVNKIQKDGIDSNCSKPFKNLPPLAQLVGWLVLTHHRLPLENKKKSDLLASPDELDRLPESIDINWNQEPDLSSQDELRNCWQFTKGLAMGQKVWQTRAAKLAQSLIRRKTAERAKTILDDPFITHLSRLCLMIADHHYSSLVLPSDRIPLKTKCRLIANTNRETGEPNQTLDEHLLGVEQYSRKAVYSLPSIAKNLPRIRRSRSLKAKSKDNRFRWQDKAVDLVSKFKTDREMGGAFIVNMASTGCGKTLANAKVMYALNNAEAGMRCAFALGLRTLTRQTGQEYRTRLQLADDDVAILVGGSQSIELEEYYRSKAEQTGSESIDSLIPEETLVQYDGCFEDNSILSKFLKDSRSKSLLLAPIAVCTIDHLVPATEGTRGGRQILPMLRLLSSDLVLDELDDYSPEDLPAVARLVHWAGLLGSRVLISSATLAPDLVHGMYEAYVAGRQHFHRNCSPNPENPLEINCIWFDEYNCLDLKTSDSEEFTKHHTNFAKARSTKLSEQSPKRLGEIISVELPKENRQSQFKQLAELFVKNAIELHEENSEIFPGTSKKISFGLIRMANIGPIFDVARQLYCTGAPPGFRLNLCVYHSQHTLVARSAIESMLDRILNRKDPSKVFEQPEVKQAVFESPEPNQIFIVLSSPVAEVGRDHDYDWAIVEPSSIRSIIQLAGRVRRHREGTHAKLNIKILDKNLKCFSEEQCPYSKPGFESLEFPLKTHSMKDLTQTCHLPVIDSRPRLISTTEADPRKDLVALEHGRLKRIFLPAKHASREPSPREIRLGITPKTGPIQLGAFSWWQHKRAHLSGLLQRKQQFRLETQKYIDLVFLPNDDANQLILHKLDKDKDEGSSPVDVDKQHNIAIPIEALDNLRILPWGHIDLMTELQNLAIEQDMDLQECARKFARVSLPESTFGWLNNPNLGFTKVKSDG